MKRIAIDTMIVDALLADPAVLEALRAAGAAGQVVVVRNHVVRDQLAAIKDTVTVNARPSLLPTTVFQVRTDADLQLIQEILGHESIQTTTMYAHISTPLRTATVARLLEEGV